MAIFVMLPCSPGSNCHFLLCLPYLRSRVYTQRPSLVLLRHLHCFYVLLSYLPPSPVQGLHPKTLACLPHASSGSPFAAECSAADYKVPSWSCFFPTGVFFWPVHRAIVLPLLLLHVFVNSLSVHLHVFCDVMAINSRRYFHFDFAD